MKTVESSTLLLTNYLEMKMYVIFSSVDRCPSLLRMALRVADRFQDPEHTVSICFWLGFVGGGGGACRRGRQASHIPDF